MAEPRRAVPGENLGIVTGSKNALPRGTHTIRFPANIGRCNPTEFESDEIGIQFSRNRKREPYIKMIPFKKQWSNMISPKVITPCTAPPKPPPAAPPPSISGIFPGPGVVGSGQIITLEGQNLTPIKTTQVTLHPKNDSSLAPFTCSHIHRSASSPQSLYVRLAAGYKPTSPSICPKGKQPSPGLYSVTVTTATGSSNSMPIEIIKNPTTPIIRFVMLYPGYVVPKKEEKLRASVGSQIIVVAYGIETSGVMARFEQGKWQKLVRSTKGVSSPAWGIGVGFTLPESFIPGDAQVRIQTRVNQQGSEWSSPFTFEVIP